MEYQGKNPSEQNGEPINSVFMTSNLGIEHVMHWWKGLNQCYHCTEEEDYFYCQLVSLACGFECFVFIGCLTVLVIKVTKLGSYTITWLVHMTLLSRSSCHSMAEASHWCWVCRFDSSMELWNFFFCEFSSSWQPNPLSFPQESILYTVIIAINSYTFIVMVIFVLLSSDTLRETDLPWITYNFLSGWKSHTDKKKLLDIYLIVWCHHGN